MRIYGNRRIKTLPGQTVRPTPSRVREAIFQMWRDRISGCDWLDLCAGSGAMGAEALCRGAATVTGIEKWGRAYGVIRDNWQTLAQPEQQIKILRGDVVVMLAKLAGRQFDCIYFDPPYAGELYQPVLTAIAAHHLLAPGGEMAVEYSPRQWQPLEIAGLTCDRSKTYGNSAIAFYRTSQQS
jgi:16S rRNA (guanine(966)-N(2))-methyltransferase RsmD